MTTGYLEEELIRDEGREYRAYPDPLTGGVPWTIGIGHTGKEVHPGLIWTDSTIDQTFQADVNLVKRGLDTVIPWWRTIDDARQDVLVNMAFNNGVGGLMKFHKMLAAAQVSDWDRACAEILNSADALRLPERYGRLAEQMKTGVRV